MTQSYDRRELARSQGLKRYDLGKPCKHGHHCERYVSTNTCVDCQAAHGARWRSENPERMRELWRGIATKARQLHPDRVKENRKRAYRKNSEPFKQRSKEWRENNADRRQAMHRRRKAAASGAEGSYTASDIEAIRKMQRNRCAHCRKKTKLTIDHIVPVSKGGSNWPRNLQLLCMNCNSSKRASDQIDHMQSMGLLL